MTTTTGLTARDTPLTGPGAAARGGWRRLVSPMALFAEAGALLIAGFLLAFWYAPTDSSTMGFSQKIFYFHAPISEAALVAYLIAFVAGVLYLRHQDEKYDRLGAAAVRLGLLFSVMVMGTGMIWGKAAWGVWWTWEPRLTTSSSPACCTPPTSCCAGPPTKSRGGPPTRRCSPSSRSSMCPSLSSPPASCPTGLHPAVITSTGSGMAASMLLAFLVCLAGMTLLLAGMLRLELVHAALRAEVQDLKELLESEPVPPLVNGASKQETERGLQ